MAMTKTCRRCGCETHFTKMSMIDYYDLCYTCREKEDEERNLSKSQMVDDLLNETDYDCGLMNDYGGGNVEWWHDYIRAEIGRCNEYWRSVIQSHIPAAPTDADIPGIQNRPVCPAKSKK